MYIVYFETWTIQRQNELAIKFLQVQMGTSAKQRAIEEAPLSLTKDEKDAAMKRFSLLDHDKKGHVTINDLRKHFKVIFFWFFLLEYMIMFQNSINM